MKYKKDVLALALLIVLALGFMCVAPAIASAEYKPEATWDRPIEKGFKEVEAYNPVHFMIGVAVVIIILNLVGGKFYKVIPVALIRALTSIGVVLIVWELALYLELARSVFLPPPTTVIAKLQRHWGMGYLQIHAWASIQRLFIAFFLAIIAGIPLGFLIANFRRFSDYVDPVLNLIRVVPPPAWLPFAILWFGIGNPPSLFIIWLGVFFPVVLNTIRGVKDTQQIHVESILNLGGNRLAVYRRVMLPSAFPTIFTGVRIGFGIGWICLVTAELVAVDAGLGWMIDDAKTLFDTPTILVGMVTICMLGITFDTIFRRAEKAITRWQQ